MKLDIDEKKALAKALATAFIQLNKNNHKINCSHKIKKSEFILLSTMINLMNEKKSGIRASDLSTHLEITPAAVTHLLNSLEKGKYVERLADPSDRRIVLVKPTEKTQETIGLMEKQFMRKFEGLTDFLGENDTKELTRLLTRASIYIKENVNDEENIK